MECIIYGVYAYFVNIFVKKWEDPNLMWRGSVAISLLSRVIWSSPASQRLHWLCSSVWTTCAVLLAHVLWLCRVQPSPILQIEMLTLPVSLSTCSRGLRGLMGQRAQSSRGPKNSVIRGAVAFPRPSDHGHSSNGSGLCSDEMHWGWIIKACLQGTALRGYVSAELWSGHHGCSSEKDPSLLSSVCGVWTMSHGRAPQKSTSAPWSEESKGTDKKKRWTGTWG